MEIILWIIYATFEGFREGNYWHIKSFYADFKEHTVWSIQRAMVLGIVGIYDYQMVPSCILVFPFFHDGMYYLRRNILNRTLYPKGWLAQSKTSTAFSTKYFPPAVRIICATHL